MSKDFETTVKISGDIDDSVSKAVDSVADRLEALKKAAESSMSAVDRLSNEMDDQSAALEAAKKQYKSYYLEGKQGTEQAEELAEEIKRLSKELKDNKSTMEAAEAAVSDLADESDDAEKETDDLSDSAKKSKEGFSIMKGAIANLVAAGIQSLISSCADAVKSVYGLAESTREYREDMGKLETAWESAGKSTDLATETYKEFYSVLGEEDRSVEAVNHLAKLVQTERDMQKWTDICTGIWGTFGDSLPIEGLTEASNETAKTGKLTGVLADALNWAGIMEDDFQTSLDECNSEQERSELITSTLNDLYSDAADKYRENNASIIEARKVQSDYTDTLAEMGSRIEPVTTAVQGGLNGILGAALDLLDEATLAEFAESISEAFEDLIPVISELIKDAMPFVKEFLGGINKLLPKIIPLIMQLAKVFEPIFQFLADVLPVIFDLLDQIIPFVVEIISAILPVLAELLEGLMPFLQAICETILPVIMEIISALLPVIQTLFEEVLLPLLNNLIIPLLEPLMNLVEAILPAIAPILQIISKVLEPLAPLLELIGDVLGVIINAIAKVIGWISSGFGWLVDLIFGDDDAASEVNAYAAGGFTDGVSIAGEDPRYPTEAIISFNPAYREQNLSYWAKAGRMLGADESDFYLSGGTSNSAYIDFGGITFAPKITINGNADKQDIMAAIEEEYPEFCDMIEEMLDERMASAYV